MLRHALCVIFFILLHYLHALLWHRHPPGAEEEFIEELRSLADDHHPELVPDIIRAYHFGCNYLVRTNENVRAITHRTSVILGESQYERFGIE